MQVRSSSGKWATRSASASGDYATGVQNPRRPWAAATEASEANFEAGVQQAVAEKRFSKGVRTAGDSKWQKGVQEKGRTRYATGVGTAQGEYDRGFAPYRQALESATLSPRGPKGQNYQRVQEVGEILRKAKNQG